MKQTWSQNSNRGSKPSQKRKEQAARKSQTKTDIMMKQWLASTILVAALLLECCAMSMAVPMGKGEDGSLEQEALASLLNDEISETNLNEAELSIKARAPRVIVVADPSLWQGLRALHAGTSLFKRRADEEHQDLNIPILRRDTMRCMVGRVYRPCWEV